jgi:threonine/homoserine/homoserine lactone efflux protein
MTTAQLIAFNIALLVALASPGPAFLVSVRTTLTAGTRSGIMLGFGLGLTAAFWTLLALLGLESIFFLVPWAYTTAKICGALYLFYIALITWRHATSPIQNNARTLINAFRDGVLIILAYVMSTETIRTSYLRAKIYLDRGASVILVSLGLSLLFQKND